MRCMGSCSLHHTVTAPSSSRSMCTSQGMKVEGRWCCGLRGDGDFWGWYVCLKERQEGSRVRRVQPQGKRAWCCSLQAPYNSKRWFGGKQRQLLGKDRTSPQPVSSTAPIELHAAADPGPSQPHQRRLNHMLPVDGIVAAVLVLWRRGSSKQWGNAGEEGGTVVKPLVHRPACRCHLPPSIPEQTAPVAVPSHRHSHLQHVDAPAQLRQQLQPHVLVLQPHCIPLLIASLLRDAVDEGQRIDLQG